MQLIKKIFGAMLIFVGILLMVALFGFAIMMIFHVSIFGYTYASSNDMGNTYRFAGTIVNSIEIDTNNADIVLMSASDSDQVSVKLMQDFQGIVKSDVKKYSYNVPLNDEGTEFSQKPFVSDGVLKIATKDPQGLMFRNKTIVSIAIPQKIGLIDYVLNNLKISTASDSVDIGEGHSLTVKDLTLINKNKSLLSQLAISKDLHIQGKLNIETGYGRITIYSSINDDVNIKTEGGSIIFKSDIEGNVNIEGDNPYVEFGSVAEKPVNTIENSKVEEYTRQLKIETDTNKIKDLQNKIAKEQKNVEKAFNDIKQVNIKGNLNIIDCNDGNVKVGGTVYGYVYIQSPNVQFWANNVEDGITCDSGANNIRIFGSLCKTKPNKACEIVNGDGHLFINHCYADVSIEAKKNGVNIKNAYSNVYVKNENYGTSVNFAEGVVHKKLEIHQQKGGITATNLSGPTILEAETNKVTAEFLEIYGNTNSIRAKSGVTLKIKDSGNIYSFITKGKAKSVKLNVNLGSVVYDNWSGDWVDEVTEQGIKYSVRHDNINAASGTDLENILNIFVTDSGTIKATSFNLA